MYKSQKCHNALQWGKMLPEGVLLIFIQILIIRLLRIKIVNRSNVQDKYFEISRKSKSNKYNNFDPTILIILPNHQSPKRPK